ncbi:MAG: (d)CMP kinase [Sciscionella sp.]
MTGALRGVVAMDGPSGTGKSTVARRLANVLGSCYLDTGAMYRAVTLAVLRAGIDIADTSEVIMTVATSRLSVRPDPRNPEITLDGADVSAEIRGQEVTNAVSAVSAIAEVRELLVAEQRRVIEQALLAGRGIVVEGRDIGTVVAPEAELKVYLTASADVRAMRRSKQDSAAGRTSTVETTKVDVVRRDELDSTRRVSPLRPAADAIELDTSELDARRVLAELLSLVDERGMRGAPTGGDRR